MDEILDIGNTPLVGGELGRIVAALAGGDAAFVVTLVDRYGSALESAVADAGVPHVDRRQAVHLVAVTLLGRQFRPSTAPWDAVLAAVAEVTGTGRSPARSLEAPAAHGADGKRSLHLVDIENLAGGSECSPAWFDTSLQEYRTVGRVGSADQVVMAADKSLYTRTAFEVCGVRYLFGTGPDGADRALLDAAPLDLVVRRFERLTVGSGDHAFAELVAAARAHGIRTTVVARPRQLARRLRLAAEEVRYLPDLPGEAGGGRAA